MTVSAPAANTWDVDAVVDEARARVGGTPGDDYEPTLQAQAAVATVLIDQELDRPEPDEGDDPFDAGAVPALFEAAVQLTVTLAKAKDEDIVDDPDPVRSVRRLVRPWKARFGVA